MRRVYLASTAVTAGILVFLAASPSSQPEASDYPALRKRLDTLATENAQLRQRVDKLVAELTAANKKIAALAPANKAAGGADKEYSVGDDLEIGMTLKQVEQATGSAGAKVSENEATVAYRFSRVTSTPSVPGAAPAVARWECVFDRASGRLLSYGRN